MTSLVSGECFSCYKTVVLIYQNYYYYYYLEYRACFHVDADSVSLEKQRCVRLIRICKIVVFEVIFFFHFC